MQFLGGLYDESLVLGGSWAGQIMDGGFRGEISYFHTKANEGAYIVAALSGDYTFTNSLYLHTEAPFNKRGSKGRAGAANFTLQRLSAKTLSLARYSIFGEIAYNVTPLLHIDIAGILNPMDMSFVVSPSLNWSVRTNWDILLLVQLFTGEQGIEFGSSMNMFALRLKWSW